MNSESSQLPWDPLQHTEGGIPWPALHAFADAVVMDPGVEKKLFEVYDRAYTQAGQQPTYADFYVAAIFALAAPRLDDERRREIGTFLVQRLVQAGRDDADVSLEVLLAAAGTMGPVIVPAVLEAIAKEPDTFGAWLFLWNLTKLAAGSPDEELRDRVIQACVDLLEKVARGEASPGDGINAAWTLASFPRPEHTDLLQRLSRKPMERWWIADYREALKLQQGRPDETPPPEIWEEPVEKWLPPRCQMVQQAGATDEDEYEEEIPEQEQDVDARTAQLLADDFLRSPVAAGLPPELGDEAHLIVDRLAYFSLRELGRPPHDWNEPALRELLLHLVPRSLPADRRRLEKIVPVTEALLHWLQFEGMLADGDALAAIVRTWSDEIVTVGLDRHNWGAPKATVMSALETGLDINKPQVRRAIVDQTLARIYEPSLERPPAPEQPPSAPAEPPIPIVERSSKPGRNDPCPCGSGKKYKKCHGRPDAEQTSRI